MKAPDGVYKTIAKDDEFIKLVASKATHNELQHWAKNKYGACLRTVQKSITELRKNDIRPDLKNVITDKKMGDDVGWRDMIQAIKPVQQLQHASSYSQDEATWAVPDAEKDIAIALIGDLHWGSYGTNHDYILKLTDDILSIPDLYVIILGDLEQMAIKMRNVLEVSDNILSPKLQHMFTESWMEEIGHKVIASVWDNHSVMREEAQAGSSQYAKIMGRKVIYFNGIGHLDIQVGKQTYKVCATHAFPGRSYHNPCYQHVIYMQRQGLDREIAMSAHTHTPGILQYQEGGVVRAALNCGTTQTNSGYAKRFFSIKTSPVFPVISLSATEHEFTPFYNLYGWANATGRKL